MEDINKRLKDIYVEDIIWIIYIGIIILSFNANGLEEKFLINNDIIAKEKYRKIMIVIFLILVVIYFYVVVNSYKDFNLRKSNFNYWSFVAAVLIFISGIIYLTIIIKDVNVETEIAFN